MPPNISRIMERSGYPKTDCEKMLDSKLVLGTAQLGMAYGIGNTSGKPNREHSHRILSTAYGMGIRILDTAQSYGCSEKIIGEYSRKNPNQCFHVITKLHPDTNPEDKMSVFDAVAQSRSVIGESLFGVLIHDPEWIDLWGKGLGESLGACISKKIIDAFGVSVYSISEMEKALAIADITLIQFPANVLDKRFVESGIVSTAIDSGKTVFVRSAFLQGLLLMPMRKAVEKVSQAAPYLSQWHRICSQFHIEPGPAALRYVADVVPEAHLIVGCERSEQLKQDCKWLASELPEGFIDEINKFPEPPLGVINPSKWPKE